MDAALSRGWTSISEQWVNDERIDELEQLAADAELPIRVDAYLALNEPNDGAHFGDWYTDRTPGPVTDRLRVRGLKITLDNGWGTIFNWEPNDLTETIGRADGAGWQVSVHTVSTEAQELVLDAFEAAIGPTGPNPLHHRIDHAIQVTDDQLARMVAMDICHGDPPGCGRRLDGRGWRTTSTNLGEDTAWLTRYRDFVDAGLHVAGATDTPWTFPDFELTDDIGRPVDQIAGGMDARAASTRSTPAWMARPAADGGAGAAGRDRSTRRTRSGTRRARPPGGRHLRRRHDPERGRDRRRHARRDSRDDRDRHDRRRLRRLLRG